jgi:hypothetical protein
MLYDFDIEYYYERPFVGLSDSRTVLFIDPAGDLVFRVFFFCYVASYLPYRVFDRHNNAFVDKFMAYVGTCWLIFTNTPCFLSGSVQFLGEYCGVHALCVDSLAPVVCDGWRFWEVMLLGIGMRLQ